MENNKNKNEFLIEIGQRLLLIRKELNIGQKEITEALGTFTGTIYRLERGEGASVEILGKYIDFIKTRGAYIPALLMDDFDIKVALPKRISDARALMEIKQQETDDKISKLDDYKRQMENIIIKLREKTSQSINEVLELLKGLANLSFND